MSIHAALCVLAAVLMAAPALAQNYTYDASAPVGVPGSGGTTPGGLARAAGQGVRPPNYTGKGKPLSTKVAKYFLHRWWDVMDMVDFSIGAGPGFLISARASKLFQFGGGWSDAYRVGIRGRSAGVWHEKRKEAGFSLLYFQQIERENITGYIESVRTDEFTWDTDDTYGGDKDRSFFGIGATVQLGILVDVNVRPGQAVDLLLGLLTVDVLEDDYDKLVRNKDM